MIIDAHTHLWDRPDGRVNGRPVISLGGGRVDFGGELRQMVPPYMADGRSPAELLLANMDFAGVNAAVVTQEEIDGSQDDYLQGMAERTGGRLKVCSLYLPERPLHTDGFDGIKLCAARLADGDLLHHEVPFRAAAEKGLFISIDLAQGDAQTEALAVLADKYPDLPIAIGHFGMAGRGNWMAQIRLATKKNVMVESGGITWLYNAEFYPYPSAVRAFRQAIDAVGAEKLMWGSDYPRTMTAITYRMSLDFLAQSTALTKEEKRLILGENARRFYGFPQEEPIPRIRHMAED